MLDEEFPDARAPSVAQTPLGVSALLLLAEERVVLTARLVNHVLDLGLPFKIVTMLFATAVRLIPKHHDALHHAVVALLSRWPDRCLHLADVLGKETATEALSPSSGRLFIQWLMEGLLSMQPDAKLRNLYLNGYSVSSLFQLPILWLPSDQTSPEAILQEMKSKFGDHWAGDDDDLETLLNWKLGQNSELWNLGRNSEMAQPYSTEFRGVLEVQMSCSLNLSEWIGMMDEVIGLMVCARTPFRFNITMLTVHDFHVRQVAHLRWVLSMLNLQNLTDLGIYGYRKSVSLAFCELENQLKGLPAITWFAMAASGPKLLRNLTPGCVSDDHVLSKDISVLSSWATLTDLYFNRVTLTDRVGPLLDALPNPLTTIYFYCNDVSSADMRYLATSRHIYSVRELTLERNNLSAMGEHVLRIGENASNLTLLNVKDTQIREEDVVELMLRLRGCCDNLETLVIYESDAMLQPTTYEVLVELACSMTALRTVYLLPFNHPPFESRLRRQVEPACSEILDKRSRTSSLVVRY